MTTVSQEPRVCLMYRMELSFWLTELASTDWNWQSRPGVLANIHHAIRRYTEESRTAKKVQGISAS